MGKRWLDICWPLMWSIGCAEVIGFLWVDVCTHDIFSGQHVSYLRNHPIHGNIACGPAPVHGLGWCDASVRSEIWPGGAFLDALRAVRVKN